MLSAETGALVITVPEWVPIVVRNQNNVGSCGRARDCLIYDNVIAGG